MFARCFTSLSILTAFAIGASGCTSDGTSKGASAIGGGGNGGSVDARFFLPTGEPDNTSAPRVETDADGNVHAVYPAYAGGGAYYAFCAKGCAKSEDVKVVRLDTDGTVANAMLALDAHGKPRVLLSAYSNVTYASCDAECTTPGGWTASVIVDHASEREVTGEALALDPEGRPRFLMHTYRALLGIGQKAPETVYVLCDADCQDPSSWRQRHVSDRIWQGSSLRFDAAGRAHVATVATVPGKNGAASEDLAAYAQCETRCEDEQSWVAVGLMKSFKDDYAAIKIEPSVALAVTKDGQPRALVLGTSDAGKKSLVYFACDHDCTAANWAGTVVSDHDKVGAGIDLALDAADHPRLVYTLSDIIVFGRCDDARCEAAESAWKITKVEAGSDMPPDKIFLYPNCTVAAWFLHGPSLAIGPDGMPRVGYQARDISGGFARPDKKYGTCVAGTDMTWSRLATMSKYD
jgi:hypothetical protein